MFTVSECPNWCWQHKLVRRYVAVTRIQEASRGSLCCSPCHKLALQSLASFFASMGFHFFIYKISELHLNAAKWFS